MSVKINDRALQQSFARYVQQLEDADRSFRETHTGLPVDIVRADATDALPSNIQFPPEILDVYAAAVAADESFEFPLGG